MKPNLIQCAQIVVYLAVLILMLDLTEASTKLQVRSFKHRLLQAGNEKLSLGHHKKVDPADESSKKNKEKKIKCQYLAEELEKINDKLREKRKKQRQKGHGKPKCNKTRS